MEDVPDDTQLTATLVSAEQSGTELTYPTNAYCATVDEAVQKYSKLTGTGTFGGKTFALNQGTAFLNFNITFIVDGTTSSSQTAVVSNNGVELCRGNVFTTTKNSKVVAMFVLPVAISTKLTNASVRIGNMGTVTINNATLSAKVYNITREEGGYTINANGDKVLFAPGNLQATYNGSNWTWKFAQNQWDYIGNAGGNTKVTASTPFINGTGTVDLFTWVGKSSSLDGVGKYGITSKGNYVSSSQSCEDHGSSLGEPLKAEWNSANLGTITNGGSYSWRTLNVYEWKYVINTRPGATVKTPTGTLSNVRYTMATINTDKTGVNGLILFPDGKYFTSDEFTQVGTPGKKSNYTTKLTSARWSALASKGCVFLPAAGQYNNYGNGTYYNEGTQGDYQSSSSKDETAQVNSISGAYHMEFSNGNRAVSTVGDRRYVRRSVRLVRAAK